MMEHDDHIVLGCQVCSDKSIVFRHPHVIWPDGLLGSECFVVTLGSVEGSSAMVKLAKAENGLFRPRAMTLANLIFRKLGRKTPWNRWFLVCNTDERITPWVLWDPALSFFVWQIHWKLSWQVEISEISLSIPSCAWAHEHLSTTTHEVRMPHNATS